MAYQRWWKTVRDQQGNAVNGASCAVYEVGTAVTATIYDPNSDDASPSPISNPFITTANGVFGFMAADGEYDVQVSGGALASQQYRVTLNGFVSGSAGSLAADLAAPTGAGMVGTPAGTVQAKLDSLTTATSTTIPAAFVAADAVVTAAFQAADAALDTRLDAVEIGQSGTDTYSTTETLTNKVWVDGKPIYRKVIDCGALPNAATKSVAHGITGQTAWVSITGTGYDGSNNALPLNVGATSTSSDCGLYLDSTNVYLVTGLNRSGMTGYAILEYTK